MLLLSVEILENVCMHPPMLIIRFIVLMMDNQSGKFLFENDILCTVHLYNSDIIYR